MSLLSSTKEERDGIATGIGGGEVTQPESNFATKLRQGITAVKQTQNQRDFKNITSSRENFKSCAAIGDIVRSRKPVILKTVKLAKRDDRNAAAALKLKRDVSYASLLTSASSVGGSSTASTGTFRGECGTIFSAYSKTAIKRQDPKKAAAAAKDVQPITEDSLKIALDHMNGAKTILDPTRLYYEAAMIFDDMEMYERAAECYAKSVMRTPSAIIIDTYDLPNDEKYRRKIERMSKFKMEGFLRDRAQLRQNLIDAEDDRQRIRARAAHCHLVRIHLLVDDLLDVEIAHANLCAAFETCCSHEEHVELLVYFHSIIRQFSTPDRKEMTFSQQLMRKSAGPIAEAHITMLHELEIVYPHNLDVLQWLGDRYAEKCLFDESKYYFKRKRDVEGGELSMAATIEARPSISAKAQNIDADELEREIAKNVLKTKEWAFSSFHPVDDTNRLDRKDFTWFGGTHKDSKVILYKVPNQGWTVPAESNKQP